MRFMKFVVSVVALAIGSGAPAWAQTTAGSGTVVVLPVVAYIPGAFTTTVFMYNPNTAAQTVDITFYQSDSATTPLPGGTTLSCGQQAIPALSGVTFDLGAQCGFGAIGTTDNFGLLVLRDAAAIKTHNFFAYSRTSAPTNNGFSVEGFPAGNFSAQKSYALGLQKTSAAPHFRSNCFVGALGEPVNYTIILRNAATGAQIGSTITDSVAPYHSKRHLDVFGAITNVSNVSAEFTSTTGAAMVPFCTVETQDNGSADFRVAKSEDANDTRQSRLACYGMDSCGAAAPSISNPATLSTNTTKNIHYFIIDQPDFVQCTLVVNPAKAGGLEIMLRRPGSVQTAPQFDISTLPAPYNAAPYTSGGVGQQSFYVYTGEKSTISSGFTTRWYVDVSYNQGSGVALPIDYGIKCESGNGVTVPWLGTTGPANP
jgi:hypothetical protein